MRRTTRDALDDLVAKSGAASCAEVIRNALAVYEVVVEAKKKGSRLILQNPKTGDREVVILL
jgi:hypothetical protein